MKILQTIKSFTIGAMFTALLCSVALNAYLIRCAKDAVGYSPQQRAQLTALVDALDTPMPGRKP